MFKAAIKALIWIDPIFPSTETDSGILLTTFRPRPKMGRVIAIGKYCKKSDGISVGDVVCFNPDHAKRAPMEEFGYPDMITVNDGHIMGLVPEDANIYVEDWQLEGKKK